MTPLNIFNFRSLIRSTIGIMEGITFVLLGACAVLSADSNFYQGIPSYPGLQQAPYESPPTLYEEPQPGSQNQNENTPGHVDTNYLQQKYVSRNPAVAPWTPGESYGISHANHAFAPRNSSTDGTISEQGAAYSRMREIPSQLRKSPYPSIETYGHPSTANPCYGSSCTNYCHHDHSTAMSITPGFPNYDRWTQQSSTPNTWQLLPDGLIFPSYLAGLNEPRLGAIWSYERRYGWMWDATAGGRMGILRYGSKQNVLPEGFQIDVEGAAMVRLDYEQDLDVLATDYRCGVPVTFGSKETQYKIAYYHVSSHLGDEYMLRAGARDRINYVRDSLVFAVAHRPLRDIRVYAEAAFAFYTGEETEHWEFQFGVEYSQIYPANRFYGSPFFAVNVHLLQELDFGGNINVQLGWQWRGSSNHLFRLGIQYFCGASDQFEFQDLYERKFGFGIWADF